MVVVCKIMDVDSDGILKHEELFEGGRRTVYNERLLGGGGFRLILSLLVLLYSKASTTSKQSQLHGFPRSLNENLEPLVLITTSH